MAGAKVRLYAAELALEVAREWVDPDAFDRLIVTMQGVELAAAVSEPEGPACPKLQRRPEWAPCGRRGSLAWWPGNG